MVEGLKKVQARVIRCGACSRDRAVTGVDLASVTWARLTRRRP